MAHDDKQDRYHRIQEQLRDLLKKCNDPEARMATVIAVLHHKMRHFFWTGFYQLKDGRLLAKTYQGPAACMELKKDTGVCWAAINEGRPIVVPDVEQFPGHIACDSRSKSEICIPFRANGKDISAVLDIDSEVLNNFDDIDAKELQTILAMIHEVA